MPNSESELKLVERQILEEIEKNPEEHVEVLQWLLENSNLPLLEGAPEEERISPKMAVEILLGAHPVLEEPQATSGIDSSLVQKDVERKQQIEKAVDNTNSKPPKKKKQGKGKPPAKPPAAKLKPATSISLSSEERSQVRQVMQGHSMKGDDFVKFGLTLLKRKVEKLNPRQAGSHINAGRQTLVRIHRNGRKDTQGMVSHQKSFLREVLQPSDN